jgi:hypothetical protein
MPSARRDTSTDISDGDRICEHWGKPAEIGNLSSPDGSPKTWPAPSLGRDTTPDEILPVLPIPPPLEHRVATLERQVTELIKADAVRVPRLPPVRGILGGPPGAAEDRGPGAAPS